MDVFVSWSGQRSKAVAEALKGWLPGVINALNPWISADDIETGTRWTPELAKRLENSHFGILCLTPENLSKPWILFEAGALSKQVERSRVVPYLLDLKPTDLTGPLSQFQAARCTQEDTLKLVRSLNEAVEGEDEKALEGALLEQSFIQWWPTLKDHLENIPPNTDAKQPERTTEAILEEVLQLVRDLGRYQLSIDQRLRELTRQVTISPNLDTEADQEIPGWLRDVSDQLESSPRSEMAREDALEWLAAFAKKRRAKDQVDKSD